MRTPEAMPSTSERKIADGAGISSGETLKIAMASCHAPMVTTKSAMLR